MAQFLDTVTKAVTKAVSSKIFHEREEKEACEYLEETFGPDVADKFQDGSEAVDIRAAPGRPLRRELFMHLRNLLIQNDTCKIKNLGIYDTEDGKVDTPLSMLLIDLPNTLIEVLTLGVPSFGDKSAYALSRALPICKRLRVLDISCRVRLTNMTPHGKGLLAAAVRAHTHLDELRGMELDPLSEEKSDANQATLRRLKEQRKAADEMSEAEQLPIIVAGVHAGLPTEALNYVTNADQKLTPAKAEERNITCRINDPDPIFGFTALSYVHHVYRDNTVEKWLGDYGGAEPGPQLLTEVQRQATRELDNKLKHAGPLLDGYSDARMVPYRAAYSALMALLGRRAGREARGYVVDDLFEVKDHVKWDMPLQPRAYMAIALLVQVTEDVTTLELNMNTLDDKGAEALRNAIKVRQRTSPTHPLRIPGLQHDTLAEAELRIARIQGTYEKQFGLILFLVDIMQFLSFPFVIHIPWNAPSTHHAHLFTFLRSFQIDIDMHMSYVTKFWLSFMCSFLMSFLFTPVCRACTPFPTNKAICVLQVLLNTALQIVDDNTLGVGWLVKAVKLGVKALALMFKAFVWACSTILLVPITRALLDVFSCSTPPEGDHSLLNGTQIVCWTGTHQGMIFAVLFFLPPYLYLAVRLACVDGVAASAYRVPGDVLSGFSWYELIDSSGVDGREYYVLYDCGDQKVALARTIRPRYNQNNPYFSVKDQTWSVAQTLTKVLLLLLGLFMNRMGLSVCQTVVTVGMLYVGFKHPTYWNQVSNRARLALMFAVFYTNVLACVVSAHETSSLTVSMATWAFVVGVVPMAGLAYVLLHCCKDTLLFSDLAEHEQYSVVV